MPAVSLGSEIVNFDRLCRRLHDIMELWQDMREEGVAPTAGLYASLLIMLRKVIRWLALFVRHDEGSHSYH